MKLFVIEHDRAKPNVETLLIPPFKDIWDRDTSPGKEQAITDFTFIEFMCSPRKSNPFAGYTEDERAGKIIAQIFKGQPDYNPDELVLQGMTAYLEFLTEASPSFKTLRANKIAVEKTNEFFTNFSYSDTNPRTGLPLHKPADVNRAVKDAYEVMKTLNGLQEKVDQELYETVKTKGSREINEFEK